MDIQLNLFDIGNQRGPIIHETGWDNGIQKIQLIQFLEIRTSINFIPVAVGCIQHYCLSDEQFKQHFEFKNIEYKRFLSDDYIKNYRDCCIVGFSVYMWNEVITNYVAKRIKQAYQNIIIIFGGPQIPKKSYNFLKKHKYVDYIIHEEGEVTFKNLCLALKLGKNISNIKGISFIHNNKYIQTPSRQKANIILWKSMLNSGVVNHIIKDTNYQWSLCMETNRGCPFKCSFCNWGSNTNSNVRQFSIERTQNELNWIVTHKIPFVWIADANFGMLNRDNVIANLLIESKEKYGYPELVYINWAKNSNEKIFHISKKLYKSNLSNYTTLSLQTTNTESLSAIQRSNIKQSDYKTLLKKHYDYNIPVLIELIVPLPNETVKSFLSALRFAIKNNTGIRIYDALLLPNTELNDHIKEYNIKTRLALEGGYVEPAKFNTERSKIIISTSTMSQDQTIYCLLIGWLSSVFFTKGTIKLISIYARNEFNIDILSWYQWIYNICQKSSNDFPLINMIVQEHKSNRVRHFMHGGNCLIDKTFFGLKLNKAQSQAEYILHIYALSRRDQFYNEIKILLCQYLDDCKIQYDISVIDELCEYQKGRQMHLNGPHYRQREFHYFWADYFKNYRSNICNSNTKTKLIKKKYISQIIETAKFSSWNEFCLFAISSYDFERYYYESILTI